MPSRRLYNLVSVRKQHLLVEFSSLKNACPHGVFVSLTPGDPTLWSGVMFIRKGPYMPSILRFQISFPPNYPSLPPLVTFSTDVFHPLVTPLTTYMYTTDIQDSGTVSATDEERLPPGGFSLRHGFPDWFGRASRKSTDRNHSKRTPTKASNLNSPGSVSSASSTLGRMGGSTASSRDSQRHEISMYEVLRYIRSTFDDSEVLDQVPIEAAGNPGAWHAWRTHRVKLRKMGLVMDSEKLAGRDGFRDEERTWSSIPCAPEANRGVSGGMNSPMKGRKPGEWNWDGVWEVRVKKGVETSITESVLFGKDTGDDLIRFLHLDGNQVESIKENIKRSLETAEPQRRGMVQDSVLMSI